MSENTFNALRWKSITAGVGAIEPRPTAIYAGADGTIVAEGDDGVSASFDVTAGDIVPIQPIRITSGPATMVALYN